MVQIIQEPVGIHGGVNGGNLRLLVHQRLEYGLALFLEVILLQHVNDAEEIHLIGRAAVGFQTGYAHTVRAWRRDRSCF